VLLKMLDKFVQHFQQHQYQHSFLPLLLNVLNQKQQHSINVTLRRASLLMLVIVLHTSLQQQIDAAP
jgi:hypothetical protein